MPAKTVAEFIAYVKANPGKVNLASSGNGTSVHLSGEMFMAMSGAKMQHVPYRGAAPAITDLLGGQVQVIFDNMPSIIQHVRAGSVRALAVTTTERSELLPDVPVLADTVPGYEASALFGMGAPAKTPPEIIAKLNAEVNAVLAEPAIKARLKELGGAPLIGPPDAFGKMIADETAKWEKVVKGAKSQGGVGRGNPDDLISLHVRHSGVRCGRQSRLQRRPGIHTSQHDRGGEAVDLIQARGFRFRVNSQLTMLAPRNDRPGGGAPPQCFCSERL